MRVLIVRPGAGIPVASGGLPGVALGLVLETFPRVAPATVEPSRSGLRRVGVL